MTRRRWIADEFSGDRAALTGAHAAHLSRTLRARVGQQFEVTCGEQVRRATVSSVQDERVEFTLGEEVTAREAVPITLLLAVFKFDRMEWAIEKCTELNVTTHRSRDRAAHRKASCPGGGQARRALAPHRSRSGRAVTPHRAARDRRSSEAARCACVVRV